MTLSKAKRQVTKLVGGVRSKSFNLADAKRFADNYNSNRKPLSNQYNKSAITKPFNKPEKVTHKTAPYSFGSTKNVKKQINSQPNLAVANLKDKVDEQRNESGNLIDVKVVAAETAIGIGIESGYYKQPVDLVENAVVFGGANILYNKFDKMGVYDGLGLNKKVACQVFSTALSVLIKMAYNKRSFNVDYLVICAAPVIAVENLNL
jgi:hypothetical protein